jgi:hypothetical protein
MMVAKRPKRTHKPSQRSIQRWENEGGAIKDARAPGPRHASCLENQEKTTSLADEVIDRLLDRSASSEQRETRKRRPLKGPKEFRKLRRDQ